MIKILFYILVFSFLLQSCTSDDAEFENVRSSAERWVFDIVMPRYKGAAIKYNDPTNQTLKEALKNDCYVKQKSDGDLALEYQTRYNNRILDIWQNFYIIGNEIRNQALPNEILMNDLSRLAYIRNQNISLSVCSNNALKKIKEIKPHLFYIYRVYIILDKENSKGIEFSEIAVDVILDNELNILNSENDLPQSAEKIPVNFPEEEE